MLNDLTFHLIEGSLKKRGSARMLTAIHIEKIVK
jgi:hypothetical protein